MRKRKAYMGKAKDLTLVSESWDMQRERSDPLALWLICLDSFSLNTSLIVSAAGYPSPSSFFFMLPLSLSFCTVGVVGNSNSGLDIMGGSRSPDFDIKLNLSLKLVFPICMLNNESLDATLQSPGDASFVRLNMCDGILLGFGACEGPSLPAASMVVFLSPLTGVELPPATSFDVGGDGWETWLSSLTPLTSMSEMSLSIPSDCPGIHPVSNN